MRQQRPTALVLAVSLAVFANAALAQQATTGRAAGTGTAAATAPRANAAASGAASSTVNATSSVNTNTQGSSTVVVTTSGGNNVVFGVPGNGTQGSNRANGTTTGTATGTANGATTAFTDGMTSPGVVPSGVTNLQARLFDSNGSLLTDNNGNALLTDGVGVIGVGPVGGYEGATIGVDPNQVVVANAMLAPTSVTARSSVTPELDRATRKELMKARTASRTNRQLLTSIAPRTDVDRSDQMPDDPIALRY